MIYLKVYARDFNYMNICKKCIKNVVLENLKANGGTLFVENAVYYSDTIIVVMTEKGLFNNIIAFIALKTNNPDEIYVNQIAVKNAYKRHGIGTELLEQTKILAETRDITCHVKDFNTASQGLFESSGFIKDEDRSNEYSYLYRHKSLVKEIKHENKQ